MNDIVQHTIRFFILASIQILILNNVQISGYIIPFVYILFIMLLPPKMPKAIVLILAFIMGFTIDVFSDSYGIHSSATVLLAFFRLLLIFFLLSCVCCTLCVYAWHGLWWCTIMYAVLFWLELIDLLFFSFVDYLFGYVCCFIEQ